MSECVVVCPACGREILNMDNVRRTPRGKVLCDDCAQETYMDVALN